MIAFVDKVKRHIVGSVEADKEELLSALTRIPEGCEAFFFDDAEHSDLQGNLGIYAVDQAGALVQRTFSKEEIEAAKEEKRTQLRQARDAAIAAGFISETTGMTYLYAHNDQSKMRGQAALLALLPSIKHVDWLTLTGPYRHTREEFIAVCEEADAHERSEHKEEAMLLARLDEASTMEAVNEIDWKRADPR